MIITWTPSQYEAVNNMYIQTTQFVNGGIGVALGAALVPVICITQNVNFNVDEKKLVFNLTCL